MRRTGFLIRASRCREWTASTSAAAATDGGPNGDPRFYQTTIDLAAALGTSNKPLASLTFGKASSANATAIYAVSGLPTSAIALPVGDEFARDNVQAKAATLGGQVTATGGEAPAITIYYGTSDGGTNVALWAQNCRARLAGRKFRANRFGIDAQYSLLFHRQAVNSAGTNWARPSAAFQTPPLTVPAITNQPASDVQGTFATLNGQILSTGGDAPTVTLFLRHNQWRDNSRCLGAQHFAGATDRRFRADGHRDFAEHGLLLYGQCNEFRRHRLGLAVANFHHAGDEFAFVFRCRADPAQ